MAYIPPHKRQSTDSKAPSLTPDALIPHFKKNLKLGSSTKTRKHPLAGGMVIYDDEATHMWFAVGTTDGHFPSSVHFKLSHEANALLLLHTNQISENVAVVSPWVFIADRIHRELLSSFHRLTKKMACDNFLVRPSIVARFGKVLFRESPLISVESPCESSVTENILENLRKSFNTNLSAGVNNVVGGVAEKTGLHFEDSKEMYYIMLSDAMRTESTLSCKCPTRRQDNKLELCKVESYPLRHMVADISCLARNLDLRLVLCTKRIATLLTDEEEKNIRGIVNSATLDPLVKGGLKWSLSGDTSPGGRFRVVGVWHMNITAYRNLSMRLKVRNVDRFDFRSATGEASTEINLKLKGLVKELQEHVDADLVLDMLKENLKLIWDNFLCFDHSLT